MHMSQEQLAAAMEAAAVQKIIAVLGDYTECCISLEHAETIAKGAVRLAAGCANLEGK